VKKHCDVNKYGSVHISKEDGMFEDGASKLTALHPVQALAYPSPVTPKPKKHTLSHTFLASYSRATLSANTNTIRHTHIHIKI